MRKRRSNEVDEEFTADFEKKKKNGGKKISKVHVILCFTSFLHKNICTSALSTTTTLVSRLLQRKTQVVGCRVFYVAQNYFFFF